MLNKGLIASTILVLASSTAFANGGSFVPPSPPGAFYLGASVSADTAKFNTNGSGVNESESPFFISATSKNLDWSSSGINGEIYAGYRMVFQDHYTLGAEIFGSLSTLAGNLDADAAIAVPFFPADDQVFQGFARIKSDYSAGVAILPGIKLSDSTTFYGRLGYVNTLFKVTDTAFSTFAALFLPHTGNTGILDGFPINQSKNASGIQLGLGFSTMICPTFAIRGEYRWERYNTFNVHNLFETDFPAAENQVGNLSIKPTVQTFNLGVSWFFHGA